MTPRISTRWQSLTIRQTRSKARCGWAAPRPPPMRQAISMWFRATGRSMRDSSGADLGDSFIKLSSAAGLTIADYFTPFNQLSLNRADIDLGSSGAVLLPDDAGSCGPPASAGGRRQGGPHLPARSRSNGPFQPRRRHSDRTVDRRSNRTRLRWPGILQPHSVFCGGARFAQGICDLRCACDAFAIFTIPPSVWRARRRPDRQFKPLHEWNRLGSRTRFGGNAARLRCFESGKRTLQQPVELRRAMRSAQFVKFSLAIVANGKVYVGTGSSLGFLACSTKRLSLCYPRL